MKRLFALFMTSVLLLTLTATALAESTVIYDGNSQSFIFNSGSEQSPTDLFDSFKGVMPGDTLLQRITVRNDASNEVKVKIYLRSLGAGEGSEEFLSKLSLKVKTAEENDMAYMFDASANETDGLTDWILLGTLYSGGEVNLDVELSVPVTLGDEFQDAEGKIEWQFKVEELPVEPDDPTPPTGDGTPYRLYIALMVASLIIITVILAYRRKEKENV